jgi:hypothetical protein
MLDCIDMWLCPWCYVTPFTPPKTHKSIKNSRTLQNTVLCDAITAQLESKIEAMLDKKLEHNNSKEIHQKLANLVDAPPPATAVDIVGIQTQLKDLQEVIDSFKSSPQQQPPNMHPDQAPPKKIVSTAPPPLVEANHNPFESSKENYISQDDASKILHHLETAEFCKEGQRETITYGKKYKYLGAKNIEPLPIPEVLKPIINKMNSDIGGSYKLNQCLVNKYSTGSATLPQHSDNEGSIDPNSCIFTISLGPERTIVFTRKKDKTKSSHIATDRSLYVMTRKSQNYFTHGIEAEPQTGVRYSITFRRVHWTNFNSTLLYGDSNFGPIQMGKGRGRVGKSTPGQKQFAANVEDIDPTICESYQNIVCMFGTNNLKLQKTTEDAVLETYKLYKGKLEQIRTLNPNCKLLVCPVLPTRSESINKNIFCFNNYLLSDLRTSSVDVHVMWGLGEFVDRHSELLKTSLWGPHRDGDPLHLSPEGTRLLVKLIKENIFSLRRSKGPSSKVDGRSYRAVAHGPPPSHGGQGGRWSQVGRWPQAGRWPQDNRMQAPSHARGHS